MPVSESTVRDIFKPLEEGDWPGFMSHVKDDVVWRVGNSVIKSFQVAGEYDKKGFLTAFTPLSTCFSDPIQLKVVNIIMNPDGGAVGVEMTANAVAKDGSKFINFYCWVTEFDEADSPKIKTVRAYLDTAIVKDVMEKNGIGM